jgi:RNA polymerase sigma-70 factor (ECF subfamily)
MADKNTTEIEEKLLVKRLQDPKTCRKAFEEVIGKYSESLYWQIRRMVQSHDDAADILQNVFMKAWSSIDQFRGAAKISTWLHKIAINESITHLDQQRKRQASAIDDPDSHLSDMIESDQHIDGDELAKNFRKAIAMLPEKQRLVFNMRYFDEMPYEQISNILGTSVGALKASYHLAAKKIQQYFEDLD